MPESRPLTRLYPFCHDHFPHLLVSLCPLCSSSCTSRVSKSSNANTPAVSSFSNDSIYTHGGFQHHVFFLCCAFLFVDQSLLRLLVSWERITGRHGGNTSTHSAACVWTQRRPMGTRHRQTGKGPEGRVGQRRTLATHIAICGLQS